MKSTSDLIKQSREEISLLDGKKYSLLIEKEQFMFSNREIQQSKCMHQSLGLNFLLDDHIFSFKFEPFDSDISRMERADAQISDQIEDYGEKLADRNQAIQDARTNYNQVYSMYANAGDSSVANFDQFKQDTIESVGLPT